MSSAQAFDAERAENHQLSLDVRLDGIALLTLDAAREKHNSVTPALCAQLGAVLDRAEREPSIAAIVITSAKAGFVEGTHAEALKAIKFSMDAERFARDVGRAFCQVAGLKKPVVAAVHGAAIGAGFELALAAHAIVASDRASTTFALPEVGLGLIPAGNGTLRIAQRAGLQTAIDIATTGKSVGAVAAQRAGLVDDVCPHAVLIEVAARRAKALVGRAPHEADRRRDLASAFGINALARALTFRNARRQIRARTHGHLPAPERVLDVLERLSRRGFEAAAELEAKAFGELVVSETAHRMIEVFFATREVAKDRGIDDRVEPRTVQNAVIVGGGRVGAAVAHASIAAGIAVRVKEESDARAGQAMRAVMRLVEEHASEASPLQREGVFARLSTTTNYSGLRIADAVIEAVPESLPLKQTVLREVESFVEPTCVYASTTSSIPIAQIAQFASRPERVLGMHYSHRPWKSDLLEIVRAEKTEPWAVATAVSLGKKQGKTPIVVKDSPGFFTTRVQAPLLAEAAMLVAEGVGIVGIDAALMNWGFPIGPLQLLDDVGIEASAHVAHVLHAAYAERMPPPGVVAKLLAEGRYGRVSGRGFYRYPTPAKGRPSVRAADAGVYSILGVSPTTRLPVEEIQMRCALALINECVRCVGEGVVRSPRDADVAAILGLGFPRFRGGPLRYVDTIGAAETLRRLQSYGDRFGERWRPAPLLVQMARKGERFYA